MSIKPMRSVWGGCLSHPRETTSNFDGEISLKRMTRMTKAYKRRMMIINLTSWKLVVVKKTRFCRIKIEPRSVRRDDGYVEQHVKNLKRATIRFKLFQSGEPRGNMPRNLDSLVFSRKT
jgi:hypothetical protein